MQLLLSLELKMERKLQCFVISKQRKNQETMGFQEV